MPEYLSPGVYVEEVDRGPKPIEGVGTAMAAFVGFTEKADGFETKEGVRIPVKLLGKAQLITNWSQFLEHYGGFIDGAYLPQAVYGYFNNGGNRCYVISVKTIGSAQGRLLGNDGKERLLARAKQGGLDGLRLRLKVEVQDGQANGSLASGGAGSSDKGDDSSEAAAAASSGSSTTSAETSAKSGKRGAGSKDDADNTSPKNGSLRPFTITVERRSVTDVWKEEEVLRDVILKEEETDNGEKKVRVAYANNRGSKWIDIDIPDASAPLADLWPRSQPWLNLTLEQKVLAAPTSDELKGDVAKRTGLEGLEALDSVTMVCVPDLMTRGPEGKLNVDTIKAVQTAMIGHCERMGDRVAILDAPPNLSPQEILEWRMNTAGYDSSYAALYYPWIEVDDPAYNRPILIPPCGHMAGIWARNDNTRGVWKAPANEVVQGAIGLAYNTTKGEQDELNPKGINCIRAFPGRGIRVWGGRTLTSDPAWRYINVRRLFNFVEKSIEQGTHWVVFEPNDHKLWARVRRDVSAFLRTVWRDGALFGLSPEDAFYVKCDEELNPSESRDLGRLIIEIGLCPVKPAEFVIFRISQWAGPNAEA